MIHMAQFEQMSIPRFQFSLALMLQTWRDNQVPPDVALALWLLRDLEEGVGPSAWRKGLMSTDTSGPGIRYIQLAAMLGEDRSSDAALRRMVDELRACQMPDGGVPLVMAGAPSEVGQTGRAYRVLRMLDDPELDDWLHEMVSYLRDTASSPGKGIVAWPRYVGQTTMTTGSTSHAVIALMEAGDADNLVVGGIRFLLGAQQSDGGWPEVAGFPSTEQSTFLVVRALQAAIKSGHLEEEATAALERTVIWFRQLPSRGTRHTYRLCFTVRLGVLLGLLGDRGFDRLVSELAHRRRQTLRLDADNFAETVIWAVTLLECARSAEKVGQPRHPQLTKLPSLPPQFLASGAYAYEFLYRIAGTRRWVRWVDRIVELRMIERVVGVLLGVFVALGVVDDHLVARIDAASGDVRQVVAGGVLALLALGWNAAKTTVRSSVSDSIGSSSVSLAVATVLAWILFTPGLGIASVVILGGLVWLVIDVVAFSADTSGLLDRVLFRR
jgi:hypothetical protein